MEGALVDMSRKLSKNTKVDRPEQEHLFECLQEPDQEKRMKEKHIFDTSQHNELDPTIWSLAEKMALGKLHAVYHASRRDTAGWLAGLTLLFMGFTLILPLLIALSVVPITAFFLSFLSGLLSLATGVCLLRPRPIYAHWHISLWDTGFLYAKGREYQVFRWDQIEKIQCSSRYTPQPGRTFFHYKICRRDGYEVKLNNAFPELAQLIDVVLERYSRQVAEQELTLLPPRDKKIRRFYP